MFCTIIVAFSAYLLLLQNLTIFLVLVLVEWPNFSSRKNGQGKNGDEGGQNIFRTVSSDFMCLLEAWIQLMKNAFNFHKTIKILKS